MFILIVSLDFRTSQFTNVTAIFFSPVSDTVLKFNFYLLLTLRDLICLLFNGLILLKFSRDRNLAGEIAQELQNRQVTTDSLIWKLEFYGSVLLLISLG
jgi:hypothetical protein